MNKGKEMQTMHITYIIYFFHAVYKYPVCEFVG